MSKFPKFRTTEQVAKGLKMRTKAEVLEFLEGQLIKGDIVELKVLPVNSKRYVTSFRAKISKVS